MPKISTNYKFQPLGEPTIIRDAESVEVTALRDDDPAKQRALIKVSFDEGSKGPACTTLRFSTEEFAAFADEVEARREWLLGPRKRIVTAADVDNMHAKQIQGDHIGVLCDDARLRGMGDWDTPLGVNRGAINERLNYIATRSRAALEDNQSSSKTVGKKPK